MVQILYFARKNPQVVSSRENNVILIAFWAHFCMELSHLDVYSQYAVIL